ncbi:MAG: M20/M25/M40 family metallo-hydrolase [Bacillota bacterium]
MLTPEQILVELIRLNTVNPPGNEIRVARYLKEVCDAAGIENEIIEAEQGRGNFLARLGAWEGPRRILYLAHSDVVPVGEGWDCDPFSGEQRGSLIYGRGARDCKGLLAAELYALLRLAREETPLTGTLLFAATADEERGGHCGIRHLLEQCPEKLRADFAVNEGGEEPIIIYGRTFFFIQVGEKGTAGSRLLARGTSCHGSVPTLGDNAVTKMAAALHALASYRAEIKFIPEVQFLLQELAHAAGLEMTVTAGNVDLLLERLAEEDRDFAEGLRSMTRMTVSPNVVQGGSKTNVVPDTCQAGVDIRILPGQDEDYVRRELGRYTGGDIEIAIPNYHPPTFSTADSPFYRLLLETTMQVAGREITCLPHISPGATDSRYLRQAGIPSFGIGYMVPGFDREGRSTVHGKNERIDIPSLHLKAEFLYTLACTYLRD